MKLEKILSIIIATLILVVISFYAIDFSRFIPIPQSLGNPPLEEKPYFIWTYRAIDVFIQGFIVFTSAAAIAALFRIEKGEGAMEEAVIEEPIIEEKEEEEYE
jgi:hypothetical protein